jgi:hypothetical protein
MKALLVVLLTVSSGLGYSFRNLRTAKEYRSMLTPVVLAKICENRAEAACFQVEDSKKCLKAFNKACDDSLKGLSVQEYTEIVEITETQDSETPTETASEEKRGDSGMMWELGVLISLVILLLLTLSFSVVLCWRSLRLEKHHKAAPEIEFKQR